MVFPPPAHAYSVLSHEEIIDMAWDGSIAPLLRAKFPQATPEEIKAAEAYAYGGCVIQDLGYYPFGSKFFSDLVHYVRSGDFVEALLRDAQDVNDYAFAIGALAHYIADVQGHPAVNRAVAIEYPDLRRRFGNVVTYDQAPPAHLETEFGFDVLQVAKQRYAPKQYHDFVGFEVAKPLLERAFRETYGLELKDVLTREDLAIGTYRHAVSQTIPHLTEVALATRKQQMQAEYKDFNEKKFLYNLKRSDYEKDWGTSYHHVSPAGRVWGWFGKLLIKLGIFHSGNYKDPTPQTEDMYFKSVNQTVDIFRAQLVELRHGPVPSLPDLDCDTGADTRANEYGLADRTFDKLVRTLDEHHFQDLNPGLRSDLDSYYQQRKTVRDKDTRKSLARMRQVQSAPVQATESSEK
jgi:hypothetical protein